MNPIEWERWSDAKTAKNKALTGLKQLPYCMTTNTSLAELTAGNIRGTPKCPLFSAAPSHFVNASFTCHTLRTIPPPLAGVRSQRELDPQCLAAAGRMVDRGIHDFVDGVEQAGDILQDRGYGNVFNEVCLLHTSIYHLITNVLQTTLKEKQVYSYHYTVWIQYSIALCMYHKFHANYEFKGVTQTTVKHTDVSCSSSVF